MRWLWFLGFVPSVAFAGYEVSTFKKETKRGANFWAASAAIDGDLQTCWMVDPEADNVGQWIEVTVPTGDVDKLGIVSGWGKDSDTFADYARVKSAMVRVYSGESDLVLEHPIQLQDKPEWQVVDLPDAKVFGEITGGRVRLEVTEVYPGSDYPALAVSEFLVHMKEFPAQGIKVKETSPFEVGHGGELMADGNKTSFWAANEGENQSIHIDVGSYGVSSVGVLPGPKTHARPKTIEVVVNESTRRYDMADKAELQWFAVPALVGYTGSAWGSIELKVIDSYPGPDGKGVAIGEVQLKATNVEDF